MVCFYSKQFDVFDYGNIWASKSQLNQNKNDKDFVLWTFYVESSHAMRFLKILWNAFLRADNGKGFLAATKTF